MWYVIENHKIPMSMWFYCWWNVENLRPFQMYDTSCVTMATH